MAQPPLPKKSFPESPSVVARQAFEASSYADLQIELPPKKYLALQARLDELDQTIAKVRNEIERAPLTSPPPVASPKAASSFFFARAAARVIAEGPVGLRERLKEQQRELHRLLEQRDAVQDELARWRRAAMEEIKCLLAAFAVEPSELQHYLRWPDLLKPQGDGQVEAADDGPEQLIPPDQPLPIPPAIDRVVRPLAFGTAQRPSSEGTTARRAAMRLQRFGVAPRTGGDGGGVGGSANAG